ncbi:hypothetical protein [Exiguobacterium sp. s193]|uniref:hypothetical protein n=1 Tax=Exiguobacterium sp. s193 TaxID=2751207 RepID=UPI001BE994B1|nr:hypothetical protein [Exiguobacterium sp. s193]
MKPIQIKTPNQNEIDNLNLILNKLKTSFANKDLNLFLSIHSFDNLFFKTEQIRWFEDIVTDEHTITKTEVSSTNKLRIDFLTKNSFGECRENQATYKLRSSEKQVLICSLDVQTIASSHGFSISFFRSMHEEITLIEKIVFDILEFFHKRLNRKLVPQGIHIILFDTPVNLASSIPTDHAYGWYEHLESIKILIPEFIEDKQTYLKKILSHELTHLLLSEISNDNLALYFQEGFALFLENWFIHQNNNSIESSCSQKKQVNDSLEILEEFDSRLMTFSLLNELRADQGVEIYHQGYLWTNYLISKYGLSHFLKFVESLCINNYVNERSLKKFKSNNNLTSAQVKHHFSQVTFQDIQTFYSLN